MSDRESYSPLVETVDAERLLKDAYVDEYLKYFNEVQAAYRIGIEKSNIAAFIEEMTNDPYVIALVRDKMRAMDESVVVTRSEILNHLKHIAITTTTEEMRFKAWSKLAKLLGMDILHVRTENVSDASLPDINTNLSTEELAAIYSDEVLND